MNGREIELEVEHEDPRQASRICEELEKQITEQSDQIDLSRTSSDPNAMDVGTVLTIVLGSGSAIALLAAGIADWLRKHQSAKVIVRTKDREVVAVNLTSSDTVDVVEAALKEQYRENND